MQNEDTPKPSGHLNDYQERISNFGNEFDPGLFLHILRKNFFLTALIIAVALTATFLYLRYTPPVYEARTIIQLSSSDNAKRILNVNQFTEDNSLLGEIELMKSKLLIARAVKRLPLEVTYFEEGEIMTDQRYPSSSFIIEVLSVQDSSILDQTIYVKFSRNNSYHLEMGGFQVGEVEKIAKIVSNPYFTYKLMVVDPNYYERIETGEISFFFVINRPSTLASKFSRQLAIKILNNTAKTIELSVRDNNPGIARDYVVAHAEEYLEFDLENRKLSEKNIIKFIDSQLDTVYRNLRDSELQLNIYKTENRISNLENLSGLYFEYFRSFDEELLRIELEESLLKQVIKTMNEAGSEADVYHLIPLISGSTYEGSIAAMLEQLRNMLVTREEIQFDIKETSRRIQSLDYSIDIQEKLIMESINAALNKLIERRNFINAKIRDYESEFGAIPAKELEFARLKRLFDINEKYYTILLEKKTQYSISKAGFVSENRILERLLSSNQPISPNKNLITIGALLLAVLLSLGIIFLKYILHNKISGVNEIIKMSNASTTVLGIIPKYKKDIPTSQLLIDKNPKSMIAESFRNLRANIQFLGSGDDPDGPRVIAITSTTSGEGKTFVAINLAGIMAYSGRKVIIIDLDMRKPKIHQGFDSDNLEGMSTLLIGKSDLKSCIRSGKVDNLDFITAGPIPPNPAELILNKRMHEILAQLKELYDVIIVDNPPIGLVTDGLPIIKLADNPIYIFRADYSRKQYIQMVDRLINENNLHKLSVVLNCVDVDRHNDGSSYGYGYGYSQGYGYYDDEEKKPTSLIRRIFKS